MAKYITYGIILSFLINNIFSEELKPFISKTEFNKVIQNNVKLVKNDYEDLMKSTKVSTTTTLNKLLDIVNKKHIQDLKYINGIIKNVEDKIDMNVTKSEEVVKCLSTNKIFINSLKAQINPSYIKCQNKAQDSVSFVPKAVEDFNKRMANILQENIKKIYNCTKDDAEKHFDFKESLHCFLDEKINILMIQKRILNDVHLLVVKITTQVVNEAIDDIYCINKKTIFIANQTEKINEEVKKCFELKE